MANQIDKAATLARDPVATPNRGWRRPSGSRYHHGMRALSSVWSGLLIVAVVAGCSGHARPQPTAPPAATDAGAVGEPGDGAMAVDAPPVTPPPPAPLTDDECAQLVDRMLAIGLAEQRSKAPKGAMPSGEQQQAIRAQMIEQMRDACGALGRETWACAVAAPDRATMAACDRPAP
jgi:hypothetical protein